MMNKMPNLFQFHKGTIKTIVMLSMKVLILMLFQFHKGTIKTRNSVIYYSFKPQFQFHKGTIKTSARKT